MHRLILLLSLVCFGASCVYTNVNTPLAYRSPTPGDVEGSLGAEVTGESCSHAVLYLVAWGDGGYRAAVDEALAETEAELLADVVSDRRLFNVLGIYQKACTRVRGRAVQ